MVRSLERGKPAALKIIFQFPAVALGVFHCCTAEFEVSKWVQVAKNSIQPVISLKFRCLHPLIMHISAPQQ